MYYLDYFTSTTRPFSVVQPTDGGYEVNVRLPGVEKKDIKLTYDQLRSCINVSVDMTDVVVNEDVYLTRKIDPKSIEAELKLGILYLKAKFLVQDTTIPIK